MVIQEFDFSTGKVINSQRRQAIICVSDNDSIELLAEVLKEKSYKLLGRTNDAKEALALVRKHKAGVLLLDADIEGVDAIGILKAVKGAFPEFNVVLVSNAVTKEMIDAASGYSAAGFLVRPIDREIALKTLIRIK